MTTTSLLKRSVVCIVTVFLCVPTLTHADTFRCAARDVTCLITSITTANTNGPGHDYLYLAAGSYMLTQPDHGADPLGGNGTGLPMVTGALTIIGAGTGRTLIARTAGVVPFRLLENAPSGGLTLVNLTLSQGALHALNAAGGCIWNAGSMMLVDVVVRDCITIQGRGGAIASGGELLLHHSFVINSRAALLSGGAISNGGTLTIRAGSWLYQSSAFYGGCLFTTGTVTIDRSVLDSCEATHMQGGAISGWWNVPATITITNSLISNNVAGEGGGGISLLHPDTTLHLENSTLWQNTAGVDGGGLDVWQGTATLEHVAVLFNTAERRGGGISVGDEGLLVTEQSWLLWNEAPVGAECVGPATLVGWNVIGDPGRFHPLGQAPCQ